MSNDDCDTLTTMNIFQRNLTNHSYKSKNFCLVTHSWYKAIISSHCNITPVFIIGYNNRITMYKPLIIRLHTSKFIFYELFAVETTILHVLYIQIRLRKTLKEIEIYSGWKSWVATISMLFKISSKITLLENVSSRLFLIAKIHYSCTKSIDTDWCILSIRSNNSGKYINILLYIVIRIAYVHLWSVNGCWY